MNKYVLDRELSEELYKRKIIKDSEFWWLKTERGELVGLDQKIKTGMSYFYYNGFDFPAPITDELLELLPKCLKYFTSTSDYSDISISPNRKGKWQVCYRSFRTNRIAYNKKFTHKKLVNALAKMLIYLDDNNYLEKG